MPLASSRSGRTTTREGSRRSTRALAIRQSLGDELGVAEVLGNLGNVALDTGDFDRAESLLAKSLPLYESNGKFFWVGETFIHLGHTVRARGEHARSLGYHEEAVAIMRQLPGKNKLSDALINLGWAELVGGCLARARRAYAEGLALAQDDDDRMRLGRCVGGVGGICAAEGDPVRAARLFAAAAAQRDREQILLKPTIQAEHDRLVAGVRESLGEVAFTAAWAEGNAMPLAEAVAAAQDVLVLQEAETAQPDVAPPAPSRTAYLDSDSFPSHRCGNERSCNCLSTGNLIKRLPLRSASVVAPSPTTWPRFGPSSMRRPVPPRRPSPCAMVSSEPDVTSFSPGKIPPSRLHTLHRRVAPRSFMLEPMGERAA